MSLPRSTMRLGSDAESIREAARILRDGGLVAFPTETVYGLGANALDPAAVHEIFNAKQRPSWDPVIVHVSSREMLERLVTEISPVAEKLMAKFWPGPLTLLMPRSLIVPDVVTAGRNKVGVRMPAHPVAIGLIEAAGVPIAAPSANRFGQISPTTAQHVLTDLEGRIHAVVDGGAANVGVESTVLDPTVHPPLILRPGGISREQLEEVIGHVEVFHAPALEQPRESLPAPGMGIRHYAPQAKVRLCETREELAEAITTAIASGTRTGVMLPTDWRGGLNEKMLALLTVFEWGRWGDWEELAIQLYAGMRWLDREGVRQILCPLPPKEGLGLALHDRLKKAAL